MVEKTQKTFSGSYAAEDVTFLLKPTQIQMTSVLAKESAIQSGQRHYSEMLSPESVPDIRYMALYEEALQRNAGWLAGDIINLAGQIIDCVGHEPVLVSLARAGTPIGVLLHRRLRSCGYKSQHYSISIIRDRGIDMLALETIISRHGAQNIFFVDGWTGKGAIRKELDRTLAGTIVPNRLCVVADPAGVADISATYSDYLIPSGILNGIVSGLISRSVLSDEYVEDGDFHACLFLENHRHADVSTKFIKTIEAAIPLKRNRQLEYSDQKSAAQAAKNAITEVMLKFNVRNINRIKPGIAEATRALLRRVPDRILLGKRADDDLSHLYHLAEEQKINISPLSNGSPYRAIAVIRGFDG